MSFQVASDEIGGTVLSELQEAGIDVSHVIVRLGSRTKLSASLIIMRIAYK
jgi:sugar/nucleoside kinase (ribokinase family)